MLGTTIVRVRIKPVSIIADEFDLLPMSAPGTNWLVPSSLPSPETRKYETNEQDTTSGGKGNDHDEQTLLLSFKVVKFLGIWGGGSGITIVRTRILDVRSPDTPRGEEFRTVGIDGTDGIVTLWVNTVDKEVRDDFLGARRLLRQTQVTVTILLDERGAVTQPAGDDGGVSEGSGRIGLIADDDDRVLQNAVPWAGEPFDSTNGPSVAVMSGLRELTADWT